MNTVTARYLRGGRRLLIAGLAAGLAATATAVGPIRINPMLTQAQAAAHCSEAPGGHKFYPGDNSSKVYNTTFHQSISTNHALKDYVPQDVGAWENWNGGTEDVFLVGMHHRDENHHLSLLYAMSTSTGAVRGAVYLPKGAHAGGVKVYKKWLYVQQNTSSIRRYSLASLRSKLKAPGTPYLGAGKSQRVTEASFFDIDNGYLYGGHFNADGRDLMRRYRISSSGALVRDGGWGPIQVPKRSQGLLVLKDTYIFSTSAGRNDHSNIYVIRRGYKTNFETSRYTCFEAPVLSEGLIGFHNTTYLLFEGGAATFAGHYPWTTADNKIKNLHAASTASLRAKVW